MYFPNLTLDFLIENNKFDKFLEKISKINYISCLSYDIQVKIIFYIFLKNIF